MALGFDRSLFLRVVEYTGGVLDALPFFIARLEYVNRDVLAVGAPLQSYYPLSWSFLGEA